jgi:hypothetical protein
MAVLYRNLIFIPTSCHLSNTIKHRQKSVLQWFKKEKENQQKHQDTKVRGLLGKQKAIKR